MKTLSGIVLVLSLAACGNSQPADRTPKAPNLVKKPVVKAVKQPAEKPPADGPVKRLVQIATPDPVGGQPGRSHRAQAVHLDAATDATATTVPTKAWKWDHVGRHGDN